MAAIDAQPGITYAELGKVLGVSKDTASNYVRGLAPWWSSSRGNRAKDVHPALAVRYWVPKRRTVPNVRLRYRVRRSAEYRTDFR